MEMEIAKRAKFQNPVMPLFGIVFGRLRKLLFQNSHSSPNTIPKSGMTGFWNLALHWARLVSNSTVLKFDIFLKIL